MAEYFSDRERGSHARTADKIDETTNQALFAMIQRRIDDGSFGYGFPEICPDGTVACGTNASAFWQQARAEIPDLEVEDNPQSSPASDEAHQTLATLDCLEFSARAIGKPIHGGWHGYFQHYHLSFDRDAGLEQFVDDVNRLFARRGIAFELTAEGRVRRLIPEPVAQVLREVLFHTGDDEANSLLEKARTFITSPNIDVRRDALEKLWDAFERIKTLEPGVDKKAQASALLARATSRDGPRFIDLLTEEARLLTKAGNEFRIRHSETDKEMVSDAAKVDYLFVRMFAFIRYVLSLTGRVG